MQMGTGNLIARRDRIGEGKLKRTFLVERVKQGRWESGRQFGSRLRRAAASRYGGVGMKVTVDSELSKHTLLAPCGRLCHLAELPLYISLAHWVTLWIRCAYHVVRFLLLSFSFFSFNGLRIARASRHRGVSYHSGLAARKGTFPRRNLPTKAQFEA